jgi:hypothetical protein
MSNFITLLLAFSIPLTGVLRRYLIARKFKELFPDRKLRLMPPLFYVNFNDLPYNKDRETFIKYSKDLGLLCLSIMIMLGALIIVIGSLI